MELENILNGRELEFRVDNLKETKINLKCLCLKDMDGIGHVMMIIQMVDIQNNNHSNNNHKREEDM